MAVQPDHRSDRTSQTWNRELQYDDGRQDTDDGSNDHQFDQCKTPLPSFFAECTNNFCPPFFYGYELVFVTVYLVRKVILYKRIYKALPAVNTKTGLLKVHGRPLISSDRMYTYAGLWLLGILASGPN